MTKIIKSRYSLFKNFEEDITGLFLFKMKRRSITRKLLSYSRVLNKVEPLRLTDLLIRRKKKIREMFSADQFQYRKIRFFYGFSFGKTKIFNKFQYKTLQKYAANRLANSILFLEARLDVILLRLHLFVSIFESRLFIKENGILVNNKIIKDVSYRLKKNDILSFTAETRKVIKRKLLMIINARPVRHESSNLVFRDLNTALTKYTWLFKRYTTISPFLILGFPRYFEINFNTVEFYFKGSISFYDVFYPFKTTDNERLFFFSNYI